MQKTLLLFALLLAGCFAAPALSKDASLQAYLTQTPAPSVTPNLRVTLETAQPSPTPRLHVIQPGDTFISLAEKYKISVADLRAANPAIAPEEMPLGGTLLIPDVSASAARPATPYPLPIPIEQVVCHASKDGLWCFALLRNAQETVIQDAVVQITLLDRQGNEMESRAAYPPLNQILPGAALPAYVFFPGADWTPARAQLLSALPSASILPAQVTDAAVYIQRGGIFAELRGQVYLPPESKAAARVWVAAVAYDGQGQVVGLRRWAGGALLPGGLLPFNFSVASLAAPIQRVEFHIEAQP